MIIGLNDFNFYESCPYCSVKLRDDLTLCHVCKRDVGPEEKFFDYCLNITIELEDQFATFVAFRRGLQTTGINLNHGVTEIEDNINEELGGCRARMMENMMSLTVSIRLISSKKILYFTPNNKQNYKMSILN
jgi:hypothetical protein